MKDVKRCHNLYAIYDVEMAMWTSPITLRNDLEAKRFFGKMLKDNVFNGCSVEFYKLGSYQIDSKVNVNPFTYFVDQNPERVFIDDTIDDGEADVINADAN